MAKIRPQSKDNPEKVSAGHVAAASTQAADQYNRLAELSLNPADACRMALRVSTSRCERPIARLTRVCTEHAHNLQALLFLDDKQGLACHGQQVDYLSQTRWSKTLQGQHACNLPSNGRHAEEQRNVSSDEGCAVATS